MCGVDVAENRDAWYLEFLSIIQSINAEYIQIWLNRKKIRIKVAFSQCLAFILIGRSEKNWEITKSVLNYSQTLNKIWA